MKELIIMTILLNKEGIIVRDDKSNILSDISVKK